MLTSVRREWRKVEPPHDLHPTTSHPQQSHISSDSAKKGFAKAQLHELCSREHWKHPVYECCHEEGPPHKKLFTFKVVLNVEGASRETLECLGNPQSSKRAAAEDAAEAAVWCLKQMGYELKNQ